MEVRSSLILTCLVPVERTDGEDVEDVRDPRQRLGRTVVSRTSRRPPCQRSSGTC